MDASQVLLNPHQEQEIALSDDGFGVRSDDPLFAFLNADDGDSVLRAHFGIHNSLTIPLAEGWDYFASEGEAFGGGVGDVGFLVEVVSRFGDLIRLSEQVDMILRVEFGDGVDVGDFEAAAFDACDKGSGFFPEVDVLHHEAGPFGVVVHDDGFDFDFPWPLAVDALEIAGDFLGDAVFGI